MSTRDEAFTEYVDARAGTLLRTARYLCAGDREAAEDLVQSTLVRTYIAWNRVREPNARDAYVRRIMVRLSYRAKHQAGVPVGLEVPAKGQALDSTMDMATERLAIFGYLRALSPKQRAVVVLRYYQDLSEQQIAEALGCSPGAVKSHTSRALATLRIQMASASAKEGSRHDAE